MDLPDETNHSANMQRVRAHLGDRADTVGTFPSNNDLESIPFSGEFSTGRLTLLPLTSGPDLRHMKLLPGQTKQSERALGILGEMWGKFIEKNNAYGEPNADDLGAKGQFADMHRKWKRIRRHLWDGEPWPDAGEPFEEVLMDFIGHLLLTIDFKRQEKK